MLSSVNGGTSGAVPLGAKQPLDTQDIRERLTVRQKEADRHVPHVLDSYALFLTLCHDGLSGRLPGICFAIKSDSKKVGEALRGDLAWTVFTLFKVLDYVPDVIIPAFGWVFRRYGYSVVKDSPKSPTMSAREAVADVAESAGRLGALAARSMAGDRFDPHFFRPLRQVFHRAERALVNLKPHIREVA